MKEGTPDPTASVSRSFWAHSPAYSISNSHLWWWLTVTMTGFGICFSYSPEHFFHYGWALVSPVGHFRKMEMSAFCPRSSSTTPGQTLSSVTLPDNGDVLPGLRSTECLVCFTTPAFHRTSTIPQSCYPHCNDASPLSYKRDGVQPPLLWNSLLLGQALLPAQFVLFLPTLTSQLFSCPRPISSSEVLPQLFILPLIHEIRNIFFSKFAQYFDLSDEDYRPFKVNWP